MSLFCGCWLTCVVWGWCGFWRNLQSSFPTSRSFSSILVRFSIFKAGTKRERERGQEERERRGCESGAAAQ